MWLVLPCSKKIDPIAISLRNLIKNLTSPFGDFHETYIYAPVGYVAKKVNGKPVAISAKLAKVVNPNPTARLTNLEKRSIRFAFHFVD